MEQFFLAEWCNQIVFKPQLNGKRGGTSTRSKKTKATFSMKTTIYVFCGHMETIKLTHLDGASSHH